MGFLRKLFGGGSPTDSDKRSFYVYVQPKRCEEVVEVRIDLLNELSQEDFGNGYFVRKIVRAIRCPFPAEIYLRFDKGRRVVESRVSDGEIVTPEAYEAWLEKKQGSNPAT